MLEVLRGLAKKFFEQSPALLFLLPYGVGILLAEQNVVPHEGMPYVVATGCATLLCCCLLVWWRSQISRWLSDKWFVASLLATLVCAGVLADHVSYGTQNVSWQNEAVDWRGVVVKPCRITLKTYRTEVITMVDGKAKRVMVSLMKSSVGDVPKVGEAYLFNSQISKPQNKSFSSKQQAKGDFDYALWLRRHGVCGTSFVCLPTKRLSKVETSCYLDSLPLYNRLTLRAEKLRRSLQEKYTHLDVNAQEEWVLSAITLGDKSQLSKQTRQEFSSSGVSHILALSGLHLGILTMFLMMMLYPVRVYSWGKWLVAFVCIGLLWCFAFLTGCSASVIRSATMLSLMLLLMLRGEGYSSFNNVVLAALLILLFSPSSLMDISFQLSFLSVGALVMFMPYYQGLPMRNRMGRFKFVADFVYVSVVAQLATAPMVALVFGQLPVYFLLANVVAIPCAYVILITALLFLLMSGLPFATVVLGGILSFALKALLWWVRWIASLPGSSVKIQLAPVGCLFAYVLLFFFAYWCIYRKRQYFLLLLVALCLFLSAVVWKI